MIALRLNLRRDGSLCLTDANGSTSSPDRMFPSEHGFTYEWLARESSVAKIDGDVLTVTLANASATYKITNQRADGVEAKLVKAELFDAPAINEESATVLADARDAVGYGTSFDEAQAGSLTIDEGNSK